MTYEKDTLEVSKRPEAGEFPAVISQVICLGDIPTKKDPSKTARKYFIVFETEDGQEIFMNYFGIFNFATPSQEGFVGFYELYAAVLGHEPTDEELATLDKFETLLGKTVNLTLSDVEGQNGKTYVNITKIGHSEKTLAPKKTIAFRKEDIGDATKTLALPNRAVEIIRESRQYAEYQLNNATADPFSVPTKKDEEIPVISLDSPKEEIDISSVPF